MRVSPNKGMKLTSAERNERSQLIPGVRWTREKVRMRPMSAILAVGTALLLSGCYSEFPIDQAPQAELDAALLGTWRCLPAEPRRDTEPVNFVFGTARPGVYAVRLEVPDEKPALLEAHFSIVKDHRLLNVRDLDTRLGPQWLFARYSLPVPNVLRVQIVSEDVFKTAEQSPGGYRRVLEAISADSPLYEEYAVCVRTSLDGRAWN